MAGGGFCFEADASDRRRQDGSRTRGFVITLAAEKLFGHGLEDDVSVMAWRSFKLPMKIAGSNNGETQAPAFADESLWLARALLVRHARCFDATLAFGRNCPTSGWNAHHRFSNHHSFDGEALAQVKKHEASKNNVLIPMLVFTGSIL